jgi:hypothetical protein
MRRDKTMVITKRRIARWSLVALGTLVAGAGAVAVIAAWSVKQDLGIAEAIESRRGPGSVSV